MEKYKVLCTDIQPITPAVGGGRIRLLGLYSGMDSRMDVVYVGSYDWRGPKYRELQTADNFLEIEVPLSEEHFQAHDLLSSKLGKGCIDSAFPLQGHLSTELIRKVQEEAKKADIVICAHPWMFPFVAPVVDQEKQLFVYDSQNCEGLLKEKLLDNGSAEAAAVTQGVIKCEWELCRASDVILACSDVDRDAYVRLYGVMPDRIISVPNGVFTEKIIPVSASEKEKLRARMGMEKPSFCFIGSPYDPNYEAAMLVIDTADRMPECDFYILGGVGSMLQDVDLTRHPNVKITGFLEEQEKIDYLHACDLALNPMLSGSGTNIKMFDFMAAGLPIITTDIGARGIENTNGEVYLLCERSADSLMRCIRKLLSDEGETRRLSEGGRREAENRYSWEKLSLNLGDTLAKLYDQKMQNTKKALMISTYPPENCGIGTYAKQQVAYLRKNGYQADVLAIRGNGDYVMPLNTPERLLELKKFKDQYDRIIIQYHESFFYDQPDRAYRIRMHQAFEEVLSDNPRIEIVCHEIKFPIDEPGGDLAGAMKENKYKVKKWRAAAKICFHTTIERSNFCKHTGIDEDSDRLELVAPNKYYTPNRDVSYAQARRELGIAEDEQVYLCIGFIQPHKAFDKVAEAFEKLGDPGRRHLYIVGSLRFVSDETRAYLELLKSYDHRNPCVTVVPEFISDEAFDTWLIAADHVVLPYQEIWSSGVLGRAKIFGKHCIVRDVGGLREQLDGGDVLFKDYEELPGVIGALE